MLRLAMALQRLVLLMPETRQFTPLSARKSVAMLRLAKAWKQRCTAACAAIIATACFAFTIPGQPTTGPSDQPRELTFGMCTVLSGPAAFLGHSTKMGVEISFDQYNRHRQPNEPTLRLRSYDDRYEPSRTAPVMRDLCRDANIIGIIGNVGTPTAVIAEPIAEEAGVPFIGAITGSQALRRGAEQQPWVFNLRASYDQEMRVLIDLLIDRLHINPEQIGFFTQRDAYGDSGWAGAMAAMKARGFANPESLLHTRYERNSDVVEACAAEIIAWPKDIKAVVLVGSYRQSAKLVKLVRGAGMDPYFVSVSFVGGQALNDALQDDGEKVIVAQTVPPSLGNAPCIAALQHAMSEYSRPKPETPPAELLEGYLIGETIIQAIRKSDHPVYTRGDLRNALEALGEFDLGTKSAWKFDSQHRQAGNAVWLTQIHDHQLVPLDFTSSASVEGANR